MRITRERGRDWESNLHAMQGVTLQAGDNSAHGVEVVELLALEGNVDELLDVADAILHLGLGNDLGSDPTTNVVEALDEEREGGAILDLPLALNEPEGLALSEEIPQVAVNQGELARDLLGLKVLGKSQRRKTELRKGERTSRV